MTTVLEDSDLMKTRRSWDSVWLVKVGIVAYLLTEKIENILIRLLSGNKILTGFLDTACPINVKFAQFMARSCKFIKDYNGAKGSRLVLTDFFAVSEVNTFRRYFLNQGRPIASVGQTARGCIGILDEINDDPFVNTFRFQTKLL